MAIPLISLRDLINPIVRLGNSGKLIEPEHLRRPDFHMLNKIFPVELTDSEKRNDRNYNDFVSNQKAISKLLIKLWNKAIDERNQELFTKEQMESHFIQLMEILKEKEFFKKLQENGEHEAYLARLRDIAFAEELERRLAMEEFIKALHEQNGILLAKRREHVADFIDSTIPLLQEIEPFTHLSHDESSQLLSDAFEEALVIDKEFDRKAANIAHGSAHQQTGKQNAWGGAPHQSAGNNTNKARALTFAHQSPAGIEVQRSAAIKEAFAKLAKQKFTEKGIAYNREDIERGATIFHDRFSQAKIEVKQIDETIERNNTSIEMVRGVEKQKDDLLSFFDDELPSKNAKSPSKN